MFQEGDVVKPTAKARKQFPGNDYGMGEGIVTFPKQGIRPDFKYRVEWKGGRRAWYNDEHLELVTPFSLENK